MFDKGHSFTLVFPEVRAAACAVAAPQVAGWEGSTGSAALGIRLSARVPTITATESLPLSPVIRCSLSAACVAILSFSLSWEQPTTTATTTLHHRTPAGKMIENTTSLCCLLLVLVMVM
jgi:hypothetical protein